MAKKTLQHKKPSAKGCEAKISSNYGHKDMENTDSATNNNASKKEGNYGEISLFSGEIVDL